MSCRSSTLCEKPPAAFHGSHLSAGVPALWIVVVEQVETPTASQAEFYWKPSEVMLITVVPDTQEDAISDYISSTSSFFTPPPLRHWKHETEIEKREAKSDQVTVHC